MVCPWCAIGRSRLDAALADFAHADGVEVVLRSFELDPSAPVGGSQPMVEVLAEKYGVPRDEAVRMMARTEGLAADEGLVMHMATTLHSNTVDAHRLLHLALATGGPDVQARLNAALVTAHFERGEDVGDHAVLRRTAVAAGLDAAAVDDVLAGDRYADDVAADVPPGPRLRRDRRAVLRDRRSLRHLRRPADRGVRPGTRAGVVGVRQRVTASRVGHWPARTT